MKSADTLAALEAEGKKNSTSDDRLSDRGLSPDGKHIVDLDLYKVHISQQLTDSGFNYLTKADGWDDIWNSCQVNADKGTIDAELREFVDNTIIKGLIDSKDSLRESDFYLLHKTGLTDGSSYEVFEQYKFESNNHYHCYYDDWGATEYNAKGVSVLEYPIDGARRGIKEDYPDGSLSDSSKAVRQWLKDKGVYKFIDSGGLYRTTNTGSNGTPILFVSGTSVGLPDDVVLTAVEVDALKGTHPSIPTDAIIEVDDAGQKRKLLVIGSLGSATSATEEIKQAQDDTFSKVLTSIKERMAENAPSPISPHTSYIECIAPGRLEVNRGPMYTLSANDMSEHPLVFEVKTGYSNNSIVAYRHDGSTLNEEFVYGLRTTSADYGVGIVHLKGADGEYYPKKVTMKSLKNTSTENPNKVLERVIDSIVYTTNAIRKSDARMKAMSNISSLIFIPHPEDLIANNIPISLYAGEIRIVKANGATLFIPPTETDVRANQKEILDAIISRNGARYNLSTEVLNSPNKMKMLLDSGALQLPIESTERFNASFMVARPSTFEQSTDTAPAASTKAMKLRDPHTIHNISIDGEAIPTATMASDENNKREVVAQDGVSIESDAKRADAIRAGFLSTHYNEYERYYDGIEVYKLDNENGRILKVALPTGTYYTTIGSGRVYSSLQAMMESESDLIAGVLFNGYVNDVANGFFNDAEPNDISESDREAELEFMSKDNITMADILARKKRIERRKSPTLVDKLLSLDTEGKEGSIVKEFLGLLTSEGIDISEKLKDFSATGVQKDTLKEMLDRLFC